MTQRDIYEIRFGMQTGGIDRLKEAKVKGLIAYDFEELCHRPIEDIGKPFDYDLHFEFYPKDSPLD